MTSFLKSTFIALFPVLGLVVSLFSLFTLFDQGFDINTLGRFISGSTIAFFFIGLFIISQPRTSANLTVFSLLIGLGTLLGLDLNIDALYVTLLSILLGVGWALYLFWYSKFNTRDSPVLEKGKRIPSFQLEDTAGKKLSNEQFLGAPTIYLFYRGNWCPLCMAQIQEIANQYKEIEAKGAQVVFISPQPHKQTETLAKKFDLGFHYLQDTDNQVAKKLGILSEAGIPLGFQILGYASETVMPTVVITDAKGIIHFVDLTDNYRVRPEPETFLEVIDAMT
jgi:peroxiredoxin